MKSMKSEMISLGEYCEEIPLFGDLLGIEPINSPVEHEEKLAGHNLLFDDNSDVGSQYLLPVTTQGWYYDIYEIFQKNSINNSYFFFIYI